MYEPDTCPVCDREYSDAAEYSYAAQLHSTQPDSRFCILPGSTDLWVYLHEGDVSEV
jgi:hypothetical protein